MGLASVATLAQTVDIPVCGIGGIENYRNALEYIMLGASAVQVGTALMLGGRGKISEIVRDLDLWGEENDIADVKEIKGKALDKLKSFEEIKIEPLTCHAQKTDCELECHRCIDVCMYRAIIKKDEKQVQVDENKCTGCGLCTFICPVGKLSLQW